MSDLKVDGVIASTGTNTNLTLQGKGTGGVKITDYLIQTKGSDISSATSLTLGKDGNQFDVTGTTTITSIATQGIGSYVTLHFDSALTFTHDSADLILPGAANITTATGDIAVMYEYASGDWRCVSYTKASGAAVVAGGGFSYVSSATPTSDTQVNFTGFEDGYDYKIILDQVEVANDPAHILIRVGTGGTPTYQTSGYHSIGHYNSTTTFTTSYNADVSTSIDTTRQDSWGAASAAERVGGFVNILNPNNTKHTKIEWNLFGTNGSAAYLRCAGWGQWGTTTAVTAIKLHTTISSGTGFDSGTFRLYRRSVT